MKEEVKAGVIIVSAIGILTAFIVLIGGGQFFQKYDKYYVRVMNAAGLETGAQVRLGGVRIGRIIDIRPPVKAAEPVTIEIGINKGTVLYEGTKALITQVGFVGDIYLLLSVNNTTDKIIKVGEDIPSQENIQMDVLMAKVNTLSTSVEKLITDVDRLFNDKNLKGIESLIGNTNSAIVSSSANISKIATSLKVSTDKLERVLTEVEDLLKGNKGEVSQLLKRAREDIERAGEMIRSIESTAKSVDKTSRSVDRAVDSQSRNLDHLINSMTRTTEELQDLLQEIKNKPWSIIYKEKKGE
ncbi:MAG TPA: MlaD family protein [Thermodesulfovibrionales bacterium]|nr:MlaD family protein [Thermodesulfovibrionales bacterium]